MVGGDEQMLSKSSILFEPLIEETSSLDYYCRQQLPAIRSPGDAFVNSFRHLKPHVFNHTLFRLQDLFSPTSSTATELHDDLKEVSNTLWSPRRIRKSILNPLRPEEAQKLLRIMDARLQDPLQNPPLQIMVFGGSIVLGHGAGKNDKWNLKANDTEARWSSQLEQLINHVLFQGRSVVKVTNMANGGMSTGISAIPLEYGIYPKGYPKQGPDLILASFGYNDMAMLLAKHQNPYLYHMDATQQHYYLLDATQRFVRASCGKIVWLVDDSFMIPQIPIRQNLMHSRAVTEVAAWYDVWGVSWTKAFLHMSYSNEQLANVTHNGDIFWPLWGGKVKTSHPNIMFHTGMAWFLFYQFVDMSIQGCCSQLPMVHPGQTYPELNPRFIPPIDETTTFQTLPGAWRNATQQKCGRQASLCSYLWIVNRATNIQTREDVRMAIDSVLLTNKGWEEDGYPVRKPRPGWVANQRKAVFEIQVNATESAIRKITIIYMKSYGPRWENARLRITVRVRRGEVWVWKTKHELEGFHSSNTSVNYEAMLAVAGEVGDQVLAKFEVFSGTTFRINGMLFCDT